MNRDDIIRMAREAGFWVDSNGRINGGDNAAGLLDFAVVVAEAEREACALIADEEFESTLMIGDAHPKHSSAWRIAAAIRARGIL